MKTVYLHIGTHKTGTTSIQNFLFVNRNRLLANGFLYPLSGISKIGKSYGHSHLVAELIKDTKADTFNPDAGGWQELLAEANTIPHETILISSENFCLSKFNLNHIKKIKSYFSKYDVYVIVYLRRQDSYLISKYCQLVKAGKFWQSFEQYLMKEKWLSGNYYNLLKPWQQTFKTSNIIIRPFEKQQLKGSLIEDFLTTIKYSSNKDDFIAVSEKNISPSVKQVKINRYYNKIAYDWLGFKLKQYQKKILYKLNNKLGRPSKIIDKVIDIIPDFIIDNQLISYEGRLKIIEDFTESNQKVAKEFLSRTDGRLFYTSPYEPNSKRL